MKQFSPFKIGALCFAFFILSTISSNGQKDTLLIPKDSVAKKKKASRRYFELSMGQTLLFISDSKLASIKKAVSVIVPTDAKLFFAEFRPDKKIKIPVFFNFPTESNQYIKNDTLFYERASPTLGAGVEFRIFKFPIGQKSALEMEVGPLASFLLTQNNQLQFAPIIAGRFRFIKNEDFIMYFGSSYSIGINAIGLIYGIGYVF